MNVELIRKGKIIRRGKMSASIPLPSDMVKRLGVEVGSAVEYYYDGDALVLKFPKDQTSKEQKSASIGDSKEF